MRKKNTRHAHNEFRIQIEFHNASRYHLYEFASKMCLRQANNSNCRLFYVRTFIYCCAHLKFSQNINLIGMSAIDKRHFFYFLQRCEVDNNLASEKWPRRIRRIHAKIRRTTKSAWTHQFCLFTCCELWH